MRELSTSPHLQSRRCWREGGRVGSQGVSPVIAVILLVAITVILAGVLYLMLSDMVVVVGSGDVVGAVVERSTDGTNWTVRIVRVEGALPTSATYFLVKGAAGDILLPRQALDNYSGFLDGTQPGVLSVGDTLLLPTSVYPSQSRVQILSDVKLLFDGEMGP